MDFVVRHPQLQTPSGDQYPRRFSEKMGGRFHMLEAISTDDVLGRICRREGPCFPKIGNDVEAEVDGIDIQPAGVLLRAAAKMNSHRRDFLSATPLAETNYGAVHGPPL
jgi:hypothetical protein